MVDAKKAKNEEAIDALELFVKDMGSFIRAYDFLSQIIDYGDTDLEKHYIFYKCLIPLLRDETLDKSIDLSALVLTHHKVRDLGKAEIGLGLDGEDLLLKPIGPGTEEPRPEEYIALSALIARMNETFEGELIHASKGRPWMEDVSKRDLARLKKFSREVETGDYYPLRGAIVGMARITGCVESSSDRFFEGPIGWSLADAVAFKDPIPYSGTLGFFYVPLRVLKGTEAATAKPGTFDGSR